jgi:1-deoxy-D-xylulose-5-phosphate synthase
MIKGTGLEGFAARMPERFFDVGIAEGHAVAMAAGMASRGAIPVFAVYSTFLQRSYDMLIHDVAISRLHIVLTVDRAGLVSGDGETHQGIFDVAYLSSIPHMTVMCPASFAELRDMLRYAIYEVAGPVAVRFPRGSEGEYNDGGVDSVKIIRKGNDFTLVTYGTNVNTAIEAARTLEKDGITVGIIKLGRVAPVDTGIINAIKVSIEKSSRLLILEECSSRGSIGESIAASLARQRIKLKCIVLLNTGDIFPPCGDIENLRKLCGIDPDSVCRAIKKELLIPDSPDQAKGRRHE